MMEKLSEKLGPCLMLTGMPHPQIGNDVTLKKGPAYDRRGLGYRAWSWLRFMGSAINQTALIGGKPFVLAVTNPPMLPHWAWMLSKMRGVRYGLLVWDIYPDHIVRQGWAGPRHPMVKSWAAINKRVLAGAEVVITIGEQMGQALAQQVDAGVSLPIEVIPNWADTETIKPLPKSENPFAIEHGQLDKVTVLYSGNMGAAHGLLPVIDAAAQLQDNANTAFLFIGDGMGKAEAEQAVAERQLANVTFLGFQPWEVLPQSLATGDIAVVIQAPGSEQLSVPSKTYTAMAAGNAILALTSPESDLAQLVNTHNAGVVCPRDDATAIAAAIAALSNNPEQLSQLKSNARSAAEKHFSPEVIFERFFNVLSPFVGGERQ
jgi:glycosyltransferase involved in cell wall biosynthesis